MGPAVISVVPYQIGTFYVGATADTMQRMSRSTWEAKYELKLIETSWPLRCLWFLVLLYSMVDLALNHLYKQALLGQGKQTKLVSHAVTDYTDYK